MCGCVRACVRACVCVEERLGAPRHVRRRRGGRCGARRSWGTCGGSRCGWGGRGRGTLGSWKTSWWRPLSLSLSIYLSSVGLVPVLSACAVRRPIAHAWRRSVCVPALSFLPSCLPVSVSPSLHIAPSLGRSCLVCLPVSVCLPACLPACLSVCLSVRLSACLSRLLLLPRLPARLSVCLGSVCRVRLPCPFVGRSVSACENACVCPCVCARVVLFSPHACARRGGRG